MEEKNKTINMKFDRNRIKIDDRIFYKGQFLRVKKNYSNSVFAGKLVKVDNFFDLEHYIVNDGGLPINLVPKAHNGDGYETEIPWDYVEILEDDAVNRKFLEEKMKKTKGGVKMPRIFRFAIYIIIILTLWKVYNNIESITMFFVNLLAK